MKSAINYYYNLSFNDIYQNKRYYYFDSKDFRYFFIKYGGDPEKIPNIYNLNILLLQQGYYVHKIILNKDGQIITLVDNVPYVLLQAKYYSGKVTYKNIISFFNIKVNETPINWGNLWENKNDYFEYEMSKVGHKYKHINESFNYYIGLGETAIQLVNSIDNKVIKIVSHGRINENDTLFDLYNPLNLIIDSRTRDIAEYFKTNFFNQKNINSELDSFLHYSNLNIVEGLLFLSRMLYPTYYFDLFEEIISNKKDENETQKITSLASDYEIILKYIYKYYQNKFNFPLIEWFER